MAFCKAEERQECAALKRERTSQRLPVSMTGNVRLGL